MKMNKRGKKAAFELSSLAWWVVGIAIAAFVLGGYYYFNKSGQGYMEFIRNLFTLRGG